MKIITLVVQRIRQEKMSESEKRKESVKSTKKLINFKNLQNNAAATKFKSF